MRGGEPDMNKVATLRKEFAENLNIYEQILSKQPYIGGEVKDRNAMNPFFCRYIVTH